ncbi:hypothetical protein GmHk_12G035972 [Glycine max]|nr:hypothetical protein GmHk_12G035972 [Glycine max]
MNPVRLPNHHLAKLLMLLIFTQQSPVSAPTVVAFPTLSEAYDVVWHDISAERQSKKWDAPKKIGGVSCRCGVASREGRRGRLEFFSKKENQETQQPLAGEGDVPEKNPHHATVVLPEKKHATRKTCAVNFFCCRGVVGEEAPRSRATESEEGDED